MNYSKVIAIDGPSGSGKSTIAKNIAKELSLTYIDTGAMFRAISIFLNDCDVTSEIGISKKLAFMNFEYSPSQNILVRVNGEDLTEKIREHEVSSLASFYSRFESVRSYLGELQRSIASRAPSILEGRDIGTIIFPNALIKVFLTADSKVRAKRRLDQLIEKKPENDQKYTIESILQDIRDRDAKDSSRDRAPLVKAHDAIEIDTSHLTIEDVQKKIIEIFNSKREMFLS